MEILADMPSKKPWTRSDYFKLGGLVVPILAAVIGGAFMLLGNRSTVTTPRGYTIVIDKAVIVNQYLQFMGHPLTDESVKQLIESAVNLAKAGQYEAARPLFEQIAAVAPVPAVLSSLGSLQAEKGDLQAAQQSYQRAIQKDGTYKPALRDLKLIQKPPPPSLETEKHPKAAGREIEPNNDFSHATEISVRDRISASIADSSDTDFYQFKTPAGPRDYYQASVENGAETLHPYVVVYDGNRHKIAETNQYLNEALKQLDCAFSAQAGSTYYVQVLGLGGTSGPYVLQIKPLRLYDKFEPNNNFPDAKSISVGSTIEANIMDGYETDFYLVKAGGKGQLTARIDNGGTTLRPYVVVYDGNRHKIAETNQYLNEALKQVDCPFPAEAGATYYVQVVGLSGTSGPYRLTVK